MCLQRVFAAVGIYMRERDDFSCFSLFFFVCALVVAKPANGIPTSVFIMSLFLFFVVVVSVVAVAFPFALYILLGFIMSPNEGKIERKKKKEELSRLHTFVVVPSARTECIYFILSLELVLILLLLHSEDNR